MNSPAHLHYSGKNHEIWRRCSNCGAFNDLRMESYCSECKTPLQISIHEGLTIEANKAFGIGDILVKIWFHNDYFHLADFVQAFSSVPEAHKASQFLKEIAGVAACYIVRIRPKYELIEKVVNFPIIEMK